MFALKIKKVAASEWPAFLLRGLKWIRMEACECGLVPCHGQILKTA